MMEAPVPMQFRVLYKLAGAPKPVTVNMINENLKDLMTTLAIDGITIHNVDFIYVHYTTAITQDVVECVAVDNTKKNKEAGAASSTKCNVVPITAVKHLAKAAGSTEKNKTKDKPRLRPQDVKEMGIVVQGLYTAMRGG